MTPKEKAETIIKDYKQPLINSGGRIHGLFIHSIAKQCSLIAVNEILSLTTLYDSQREVVPVNARPDETKEYWENVKTEIENMQ